jgi:thioesterase domain-containing protein
MKELLQETLLHEIPLTQALGLKVEKATSDLVRLSFPLEPNHNHKQTAFGGSLYCAVVLAGWSVAWCGLQERGVKAQVVIAGSGERFMQPVTADFIAECQASPKMLDAAFKMLARKGIARLELESRIFCREEACVSFQGTYGLIKV